MLGRRLYEAAREGVGELRTHPEVVAVLDDSGQDASAAGYALAPALFSTTSAALRRQPRLHEERFGAIAVLVSSTDLDDLLATIEAIPGRLTATLHATDQDEQIGRAIADRLLPRAGRLIYNGVPTGRRSARTRAGLGLDGEPAEDESLDRAVVSLVLCSVPDQPGARGASPRAQSGWPIAVLRARGGPATGRGGRSAFRRRDILAAGGGRLPSRPRYRSGA
jgi:hypothetical protein